MPDFKKLDSVFRDMALNHLGRTRFSPVDGDLCSTLSQFPWDFQDEFSSPSEELLLTIRLDPRTHLGRLAVAFAIIETFFPMEANNFFFGEVMENHFWNRMIKRHEEVSLREDLVERILRHEECHAVVAGDGFQFDLSSVDEEDVGDEPINHPKVLFHDRWKGVAASALVNMAIGRKPEEALDFLRKAERLCPKALFTKYNMVEPLIALGRVTEAKHIVMDLASMRPTAKILLLWQELCGAENALTWQIYGDDLWTRIRNHLRMKAAERALS